MKINLITFLALATTTSAYTRFTKFEECQAFCDNNPVCQSAFFDTILGDCQDHECIWGQTPPERFKPYIKSTATEYCPGTSPTSSWTAETATETSKGTSTTAAAVAKSTSGGAHPGAKALLEFVGMGIAMGLFAL